MSAQPVNPNLPPDHVTVFIDGNELAAPKGSMIIHAADKAGIPIPRFCYHYKLPIAANCRMCLVEAEMGDVLFALVNLSRHMNLDAEGALRRTIDKFTRRFAMVERRVHEVHGGWPTSSTDQRLGLEELDSYWEEAKRAGI